MGGSVCTDVVRHPPGAFQFIGTKKNAHSLLRKIRAERDTAVPPMSSICHLLVTSAPYPSAIRQKECTINNMAVTPIAGTFANLPDGGTITTGSNTFQANYEGGDGNDLTLTVQ